jgi:3-oxoacyl-[acyl-carrier-protein] synthase-3
MTNVASRLLANSGVEYRHFAIDPATRDLTHTVATLAEEACRRAMSVAGVEPEEIDLLVLSASNYDQSTPPTSAILQQRLGIERCVEMEIHSNCSGVGKSVQVAYDALRVGRYKTALVVYSQLSSVYLRSCYFNQPVMTKTQGVLRYILADGSGAVLLRGVDAPADEPVPHEIIGTYVESIGGKREPAMTAGGGVRDLTGYNQQIPELYALGRHHLDQDFSAVNRNAAPVLFEGIVRMVETLGLEPTSIRHIVVSIPTKQLYEDNVDLFLNYFGITRDQIKFRAGKTGYCGGASLLLHVDEMARTNELKPGDLLAVHAVESSKWMTAGFVVRW